MQKMFSVKIKKNTKINLSTFLIQTMVFLLPFLTRELVLFGVVICFAGAFRTIYKRYKRINKAYRVLFALYFFVYVLSILFAHNHIAAGREAMISLIVVIWCFCVVAICLYDSGIPYRLISLFLCSVRILAVLYLVAVFTRLGIFRWVLGLELVITSNHFCFYIGAGITCSFALLLISHKLLYLLDVIVGIFSIIVSGSRGALIAVTVAGILVLFKINLINLRTAFILIVIMIIMGSYLFLFGNPFDFLAGWLQTNLSVTSSFSNRERYALWTSSLKMFSQHIFGVGAGNWFEEYAQFYRTTVNLYPHVHNVYIQYLCELGIQGIGVLIAFIAYSYHSVANLKNNIEVLPTKISCIAIVVYSAIAFAFNGSLNSNKPLLLFFMFISICAAMKSEVSGIKGE